jgi:hypothetical protein
MSSTHSVIAENSQGLSNRLVEAADTNFYRMFNLLEIQTGILYTSSRPRRLPIMFRFFFVRGRRAISASEDENHCQLYQSLV